MKPAWLLVSLLLPVLSFAADVLKVETRSRKDGEVRHATVNLDPRGTAIIICDMWDQHWCKGATERVAEMAPRMNEVVEAARKRGMFIIHAPSETMEFYKDTPQRKRALETPLSKAPSEIGRWRRLDKDKEPPLPIDDSDGGCDDIPKCKGGPPYPWKRQIATITVVPDDAVSDNGQEVYNLLQQHSRSNVIVMGVHANMCVLGRSFAIRQMVAHGKNVFLMRDMTDTMYCSRMRPFTNHFRGTDLVVEHIEKHWCPSITSTAFTGKPEFRFKEDEIAGNDTVRDHIRRFKGRGQTVEAGKGARALSPKESLERFRVPEGLKMSLALAEPDVRQPVCLNFDERGRMWVVQYLQYPFPAGLKVIKYDEHLRAVFDKVPAPPPKHVPGADKVTIYEDRDKDGYYEWHKDFVTGLNIATSALVGDGGVWVMNPPYLLFYPDKDKNDEPDGPPEVRLEGFGLEDTHAVANSLVWGPDGWLYGAQGSTCTATIRGIRFLGQAIWRYHPKTDQFELFAEGGGNTFCVTFDRKGRLFSGTNWGNQRGLYFVQGGYYVKGWGKHGPLTNPHAYGFFPHMPHDGDQARFSHALVIYEGDALPDKYYGKMFSIVPLQNRVQVSELIPDGSSYKTRDTERLVETDDKWFRPVDIKIGPDGAMYIADWYDVRLTHVDPRDDWDRSNGRIYRLSSEGALPRAPASKPPQARPSGALWEVRLLGDKKQVSDKELERLVELARYDSDPQVRSQLASSAKRLPVDACLAIVGELLKRDEDLKDPHIPLLLWWAIESKAVAHKEKVSKMFLNTDAWRHRMVDEHIIDRLVQRYAAEGDLELVAKFMARAPDDARRQRLLVAIAEAYKGRKLERAPDALREQIAKVSGNAPLKLRLGIGSAEDVEAGIQLVENESADKTRRTEMIDALEGYPQSVDALLKVATGAKSHSVRKATLHALQGSSEARIASKLLEAQLPKEEGVRARALDLLSRRPEWSRQLLAAIEAGKLKREDVPFDAVQRVRLHDSSAAEKVWGAVRKSSEEKQARMRDLAALLADAKGDAIQGKQIFTQACAACHKLHGEGANLAPDLTGYERDNLNFWLLAIVDPNAGIREEYTNFELETTDNLLLTGFIVERGSESVTIEDGEQGRVAIAKGRIRTLKASANSRMPEGLLDGLSEQQIQDLFAYLRSTGPLVSF